ncbi:hypothetical protein DSM112329_05058 [Paraconexibacter sp. AEG42_29]|uniref:D-glucuronyl C5-epimerase C-terminal domain-containing protein n=1 Tax=Paraconexibacter sp. AEG42_29 TaxID=2997339 RepID=A0AAU7B2T0_9ACTN
MSPHARHPRAAFPTAVLWAVLLGLLLHAAVPAPARASLTTTPPVAVAAVTTSATAATGVPGLLATAIEQVHRDARRARTLRLAEAARLAGSSSPEAVIRRRWLLRRTSRATYDAQRGVLVRARRAAARLPGLRGREQRAAVAVADALTARGLLTADRLHAVLLTIDRNTDWWSRRGAPPYGRAIARGKDPVTLKYVPGHGLVLHQLASWGRVNWLAGDCLRHRARCPRRQLRAAVDTLMRVAVRRRGVVRAESYFAFGGAPAPWISGMTQGTMIQALTRSSTVLRSAADRRRARAALTAFTRPAPEGVAVAAPGGTHYLMYSTRPGLRILNGHLQALTGLRDLARIGGSRQAGERYRAGERAAWVQLRRADTGAWSRYADGGPEATLGYHRLVTGFLANLCDRDAGRRYCRAAARFRRYVTEPTRVSLRPVGRPRSRRPARLGVWLSKVSAVSVSVRDARGRVVMAFAGQLERGSHTLRWKAPHHGRYRVRVTAVGPGGPPSGRASARVDVRRPSARRAR